MRRCSTAVSRVAGVFADPWSGVLLWAPFGVLALRRRVAPRGAPTASACRSSSPIRSTSSPRRCCSRSSAAAVFLVAIVASPSLAGHWYAARDVLAGASLRSSPAAPGRYRRVHARRRRPAALVTLAGSRGPPRRRAAQRPAASGCGARQVEPRRGSRSRRWIGSRRRGDDLVEQLLRRRRPRGSRPRARARMRACASARTSLRRLRRRRSTSVPSASMCARCASSCSTSSSTPWPRAASVLTIGTRQPRLGRQRQHAADLAHHRVGQRVVGLVDDDHVGDLHDAGLQRLDRVARAGHQHEHDGVGVVDDVDLGLADADGLEEHVVACRRRPSAARPAAPPRRARPARRGWPSSG